MTTTVFCKLLQKDLPKLAAPPFPGEKGSEIFEHFSEEAWAAMAGASNHAD